MNSHTFNTVLSILVLTGSVICLIANSIDIECGYIESEMDKIHGPYCDLEPWQVDILNDKSLDNNDSTNNPDSYEKDRKDD